MLDFIDEWCVFNQKFKNGTVTDSDYEAAAEALERTNRKTTKQLNDTLGWELPQSFQHVWDKRIEEWLKHN